MLMVLQSFQHQEKNKTALLVTLECIKIVQETISVCTVLPIISVMAKLVSVTQVTFSEEVKKSWLFRRH